jgi:hypothetical protein
LVNGDTDGVFTGALHRVAGEGVGTYAIDQGDLSAGSNYSIQFTGGVTFAITPRDLTVTPMPGQSKVYGANDPAAFAYTHGTLYNGDPETVLSGALSRVAGEHVGPHSITQGTLSAGSNYTIQFTTGVTFAITPRDLTVTPSSGQSKVYGANELTLTYTHGTLYNGDTDGVFTGALHRVAGETVGTYAIDQGTLTAGADYSVGFTSGVTFAITPRNLTVTPNSAQSKVYGATDPVLTYSHGTLVNSDTETVFTGALGRATGESVIGGPYAITQSNLSAGANYTIDFTGGVTFAITPRPLVVTATNVMKTLGALDPTLAYTHGTLYNGDTDTVFSGALIRDPGESIDSYPIRQGTLSAGTNYSISFVNGTLKITYATTGTCNGEAGHQILQPINTDGMSVFKQGSTVPAKFRVCDANGVSIGTAGVVMGFTAASQAGTATATVNETIVSTTPDTAFRWDPTAQQWIFNISTKNLKANTTYMYDVALNDGTHIRFQFGLK